VGTAAYLSPEQAMGSPLSPATDVYSLGLVLLGCVKQAIEYPGSAVESAVARLHRPPVIPEDLPAEWTDLIRSMTAIDPLERPTAADIETALRQALVSPTSTPGQLAPETTRVLPAMPFRAPTTAAEPASTTPSLTDSVAKDAGQVDPHAAGTGRSGLLPREEHPDGRLGLRRAARSTRAGRKGQFWAAAVLVVIALAGGAAALTAAQAPDSTSGVVPYPVVTGALGDHLLELQKSVEP